MAAVAAHVGGHVLDDAQDGHAHLLEHLDALLGVQQRNILRGGDDHRAGHGHALAQGELDVARARGHVDDEVVQVFPVGLAQELLQRLGGHGAAPDHGFVLVHQKADGHDLHAVVFERLHGLAVVAFRAAVDAQHHGLAGAVDVGVEHAHAGTLGRQGQGQVGGGGALAHATLARGHGNDVLHLGQELHTALHGMGDDLGGDVDRHVAHPGHALGGGYQAAAQLGHQALGGVAQLHVKRHVATADLHVAQGAGADKILARVGVEHAGKCGQKALFGD